MNSKSAKQLIDEVTAKQDELILFIDELHTIVGAGQGGGEGGLAIMEYRDGTRLVASPKCDRGVKVSPLRTSSRAV